MKTLYYLVGGGFLLFAVAWYFTWAVIHANVESYGRGPNRLNLPMPAAERRLLRTALVLRRVFRWLTLVFLAATLLVIWAWERWTD